MSETANRPPGFSTLKASRRTAPLSSASLITQLKTTMSTELSGSGTCSMVPVRKIAFSPAGQPRGSGDRDLCAHDASMRSAAVSKVRAFLGADFGARAGAVVRSPVESADGTLREPPLTPLDTAEGRDAGGRA